MQTNNKSVEPFYHDEESKSSSIGVGLGLNVANQLPR